MLNKIIEEIKKLNIEITDEKLNQLETYYNLLIETNEHTNLTAITNKEDVYLKHFYDSLTVSKIVDLNKEVSVCDIGCGAGFPGIVLKIFFPNIKITLLDSTKKKTDFIDNVVKELNLKNVTIINDRAENFVQSNVEKFDIITSRAVARLNILLELSAKAIKINGHFIALKGQAEEEIEEAKNALKKLNMKIEQIEKFNLPIENSNRSLIKIVKFDKTPQEYPRIFTKIKKMPL